jgi:hypothetical protein
VIKAGVPVIDMDTLIAPLDQIDVHSFLAPDNEFMGARCTGANGSDWDEGLLLVRLLRQQ